MHIERHSLSTEFPEYKDTIHQLKLSDAHFGKLLDEYNESDEAVRRAENGVAAMGDVTLENLKKVRMGLKDRLFERLKAA
jgi:uncharacterized protein YdcH (DUF465 family)